MAFPGSKRRRRVALAAAAWSLLLAACEAPPPPPDCPRANLVEDADRVVRFAGSGRDITDQLFEARISDITGECVFTEGKVAIDMKLRIEAARGQALEGGSAPLGYFVAIVGPDGSVRARKEFETEVPFQGRTRSAIIEELEPEIPLAEGERADYYTVYVGLLLSHDELDYNRRQRP
jgi:hypothetical protein